MHKVNKDRKEKTPKKGKIEFHRTHIKHILMPKLN